MGSCAHIEYTLFLADNALILGHRNSEWTGHGPILEQDIALSNIALDLIGQARWLYQHAGRLAQESQADSAVTEDSLAYGRDSWDFRNCLLVEQPNGDWGKTIMRQFLFSAWQYYYFEELHKSRDCELAAIAEKSLKEVTYHLRWSGEWVIRLGDGTDESHRRMVGALDQLWKFTGELFVAAPYELALMTTGIAVDPEPVRRRWNEKVREVLDAAQLTVGTDSFMQRGGKDGKHTEHLGYLLAEMQFLQRAYPNCEW